MKKKDTIVLLDMDNVIFDFTQHFADKVNQIYGTHYTKSNFLSWDLESDIPEIKFQRHLWEGAGFYQGMSILNDAADFVPKIAEKYNTFIVSHSPTLAFTDKVFSLEEHFGNLFNRKTFFTECKGMVRGNYLLDDKMDNLHDFGVHANQVPVCYNMSYNQSWSGAKVNNMSDFYDFLNEEVK